MFLTKPIIGKHKLYIKNGYTAVIEGSIEDSNMPSEFDAVDLYQEAEVMFLPSKAANAGGVAVSGLELTQN